MTRDGLATLRASHAQSEPEQKAVYAGRSPENTLPPAGIGSTKMFAGSSRLWKSRLFGGSVAIKSTICSSANSGSCATQPPHAWLPSGSSFKSTPSQCLRMSRNFYFRKRLALAFETVQQSLLKRRRHSVERTCFKVLRSQSGRRFASRQIQFNPKSKCKSMCCYTLLCKSQT